MTPLWILVIFFTFWGALDLGYDEGREAAKKAAAEADAGCFVANAKTGETEFRWLCK